MWLIFCWYLAAWLINAFIWCCLILTCFFVWYLVYDFVSRKLMVTVCLRHGWHSLLLSLRFVLFWLAEEFGTGARLFIGNRNNCEDFEQCVRNGQFPQVGFELIVDCRGGDEQVTNPFASNCKRVGDGKPYAYTVANCIINFFNKADYMEKNPEQWLRNLMKNLNPAALAVQRGKDVLLYCVSARLESPCRSPHVFILPS